MNNSNEDEKLARQKILIVDDKEANLFALEKILKNIDADVVQADCGNSALAEVLTHEFSLILLDVRMPGMDGYEVAKHLQGDRQTKNIPIIFVTAEYPDEEHVFRGYDVGAIDYLLKPYAPKILLSKVRVLLEMDRTRNELQQHRDSLEQIVSKRTAELQESRQTALEMRDDALLAKEKIEMFQFSLDHSVNAVFWVNPDASFSYVNIAACENLGYTEEELLKLSVYDIDSTFYPENWSNVWKELDEQKEMRFESVYQMQNGETFPVEVTVNILSFKEKEYICIYSNNITDRKQKEEQFLQVQKMHSIGQLVAGVAHDFNNLLQIINGYADIARSQIASQKDPSVSIDEIATAGGRANKLIQQLLAFSRQQVIKKEGFNLNEEIQTFQKMLRPVIGEHVEFEFIEDKAAGVVFADKGHVHQVLVNLCVNARDAMPDGGVLTMQTESITIGTADLKKYAWAKPGDYVLLRVRDTGCGMEPETCKKIFEPFFTTKNERNGTGLGLSTVYGVLKQNNGHINVTSEPDKGTEFNIYLPVSTAHSTQHATSTEENQKSVEGGVETLLVVEDDAMILDLSKEFLESAGYEVLSATNGEEAVLIFQEHADEIDGVIMDVVMPRMGGKDAMKKILMIKPQTRHLFVSGYSPNAGHNDFIKKQGAHLLSKPYRSGELLTKIREVLDEE